VNSSLTYPSLCPSVCGFVLLLQIWECRVQREH
jgi:hypothetical protein